MAVDKENLPSPESLGLKYRDETYYQKLGIDLGRNKKDKKEENKQNAKERATAHLNKGGSRDAEFDSILKEGGLNNHTYQQAVNADRKKRYDNNKETREKNAYAYGDFVKERNEHRGDNSLERKVDKSAHYNHMMESTGSYGVNEDKVSAVERLMETGQKFDNLDVKRERNNPSNHAEGLYKAYGGKENYVDNYSVESGNWSSRIPQNELGTMKEADDSQRKYWENNDSFFNSEELMSKYGNFDFFNKAKERSLAQSERFNNQFDIREQRMADSRYGKVYGY